MNPSILISKKNELDSLQPFNLDYEKTLEKWFRTEFTYANNTIEENPLNRRETDIVINKNLTVMGRLLTDHIKTRNYALSFDWIKKLAKTAGFKIEENTLIQLNKRILSGIDDDRSGTYRFNPFEKITSKIPLPHPEKIPALMGEFINWLEISSDINPLELASQAHFKLLSIKPFQKENGPTARLLMNLILLKNGYPPASIRKCDRLRYAKSLNLAHQNLAYEAISRSLDIALKSLKGEEIALAEEPEVKLLKIGQIAKVSKLTHPTIRHWTALGLLSVTETTKSGYQLYHPSTLNEINTIQSLKEKGHSLQAIKAKLA